ncbi:uncharacterized protein FRV6_00017 [Fusarium oxysporum]|uniref:Uncharacterized protein n=1 Tax=Fusarium oxysporum TaxID=5507 RepID=A0A2H3SQZ4_FUSOX|nr:uncharacterized protein FRV6_00017 [Fusarium oxysporum]
MLILYVIVILYLPLKSSI